MDFYYALSDIRHMRTGDKYKNRRTMWTRTENDSSPLLSVLSECRYPKLFIFALQAFSCYPFRVNKKGPKDPTYWIKLNPHKITYCETCEHIVKSQNPGSRTVVLLISFQTKKYYTQKIRNHRLFNINTVSQRTMEQCFENAEGKWFLKT